MKGKEPENSTSFPSLAAHIWSESGVYVCICPWVGSWLFFLLQNPHFGLCALCVAGIKCSTLTVPFNACQPPSQASKLILWLHKYFAFLGFWCFQSSCSYSSWEDLVSSCHQPSRCLCWPGAWGTPAWGAKHLCLLSLCGGVSGSSSSACTRVWWQHLSSSGQQVLRRWSGQTDSLAAALTPPRTSGAFLARRRWGKNLLWRCQLFFPPPCCVTNLRLPLSWLQSYSVPSIWLSSVHITTKSHLPFLPVEACWVMCLCAGSTQPPPALTHSVSADSCGASVPPSDAVEVVEFGTRSCHGSAVFLNILLLVLSSA